MSTPTHPLWPRGPSYVHLLRPEDLIGEGTQFVDQPGHEERVAHVPVVAASGVVAGLVATGGDRPVPGWSSPGFPDWVGVAVEIMPQS